jgi:hypothetical protein
MDSIGPRTAGVPASCVTKGPLMNFGKIDGQPNTLEQLKTLHPLRLR